MEWIFYQKVTTELASQTTIQIFSFPPQSISSNFYLEFSEIHLDLLVELLNFIEEVDDDNECDAEEQRREDECAQQGELSQGTHSTAID